VPYRAKTDEGFSPWGTSVSILNVPKTVRERLKPRRHSILLRHG
jgi:hypothetical protein